MTVEPELMRDELIATQLTVKKLRARVAYVYDLAASLDDVDAEKEAEVTRRLWSQLHKIVEESTRAKTFVHKKFSRTW